ncbi:MAG: tetratricopeptide repeat protein [Cyanobacteria bacterium P01_A01_bin.114]
MKSLEIVDCSTSQKSFAVPALVATIGPAGKRPAASQISARTEHSALAQLSEAEKLRLLRRRIRRDAQCGQYESAIRLLSYLIYHHPGQANDYNNRGLMYQYRQQWSKAMADFNQALTLQPTADRIYNNRANCYAAQQDWLNALDDYDRAIDINPFNMRARINQAVTFREMGQYEDALECFDIAMFFGQPNASLLAERGRTNHLHGHWNCAARDYGLALEALRTDAVCLARSRSVLKKRVQLWEKALLAAGTQP